MSKRRSNMQLPGGKRKKVEFISPEFYDSSKPRVIDWLKCFICQEDTNEKLKCSMNATSSDPKDLYLDIAVRVKKYNNVDKLPVDMDITALEGGGDLGESLYKHGALHHKSCKLLFSNTKLDDDLVPTSEISSDKTPTRSSAGTASCSEDIQNVCFFCDIKGDDKSPLYRVLSFRLDQCVRRCAVTLKDYLLQGKLAKGDMIAQDAMYHNKCILDLYRRSNTKKLEGTYTDSERRLHGIAFSDLLSHMRDAIVSAEGKIPVFVLSSLTKRYCDKLKELGVEITGRLHSTRLKKRILSQFEDLYEYKEGREILLAFRGDIGDALSSASIDYDDEGYILAEAARIIRRDIKDRRYEPFVGKFEKDCQESFVPESVQALVTMILRGTEENNNPYFKQAMLTIGQMMIFNSTIRTRKESSSSYHSQMREPPLAIYLAQMIHCRTRKIGIVEKLSHLGLCISSIRLMNISTSLGNTAIDNFEKDGVVCPRIMRLNHFTVAAVDNIDVNPSSSQAMSSLHGTAASLHQKVNDDIQGRRDLETVLSTEKVLKKLPMEYTEIKPARLPSSVSIPVSGKETAVEFSPEDDEDLMSDDHTWLEKVRNNTDGIHKDISWSAFHVSHDKAKEYADISSLLPIWRESSKSPAMIKHTLDVISKAISFLNPGQTSVIAFDQPLYAIAKQLQWQYPNIYGLKNFVIMDFDAWRIMMEEKNPNCQFWSITYDMERYFFSLSSLN